LKFDLNPSGGGRGCENMFLEVDSWLKRKKKLFRRNYLGRES